MSLQNKSRAHISRAAIQRLYIAMRHLFIRGSYKPLGVSGETMIEALTELSPEIYGTIKDQERVELDGLFYIFERLPKGIEECRFVKLISREGFENSEFQPIVPPKRRRNSYRIDDQEMYIEMTRGRSDIYDILTHLTFMYIESEKIRRNSENHKGEKRREWLMLEDIVTKEAKGEPYNKEVAYTYMSTLLGRTYEETVHACQKYNDAPDVNSIFHITYWLGMISTGEATQDLDREISFSGSLRESVGHHIYGEQWALNIKEALQNLGLLQRPIHIISANLHSIMNSFYAKAALKTSFPKLSFDEVIKKLSLPENGDLRHKVNQFARRQGMVQLDDTSGTNISIQIYDLLKIKHPPEHLEWDQEIIDKKQPVIVVMDYAFGEQAYETMDELLRPVEWDGETINMPVQSINIMGKAGILEGGKGDIMVPTAHVFEGSADNYPFENALTAKDLEGQGVRVLEGPMITVLGTSLQNRDILKYFFKSSWRAIGLEMEGAHYQKAIQSASKIRQSIEDGLVLRYAYYASDNPLETGHTLASGSLGMDGVLPTYLISQKIINGILGKK